MKKTVILYLLFMMGRTCAQSQSNLLPDSTYLMVNMKVQLLPYMNHIKSFDQIEQFFKDTISCKLLQSKGFSDRIYFVNVHLDFDSSTHYKFICNDDFVFAYNQVSKSLYRLKGFKTNDFPMFLSDLVYGSFSSATSERDLLSEKKFIKKFYIEGLDLKCLYRYYRDSKKKKLQPCLKPVTDLLGYPIG